MASATTMAMLHPTMVMKTADIAASPRYPLVPTSQSFSTLLRLRTRLECCNHRLNPQPGADIERP
jgi:hypothetical protein